MACFSIWVTQLRTNRDGYVYREHVYNGRVTKICSFILSKDSKQANSLPDIKRYHYLVYLVLKNK